MFFIESSENNAAREKNAHRMPATVKFLKHSGQPPPILGNIVVLCLTEKLESMDFLINRLKESFNLIRQGLAMGSSRQFV